MTVDALSERAFALLGQAESDAVWQGCELLASLQDFGVLSGCAVLPDHTLQIGAGIQRLVRPEHQAWVALWSLLQQGEPIEEVRLAINARPFIFSRATFDLRPLQGLGLKVLSIEASHNVLRLGDLSAVALPTLEELSLTFCSHDSLDGLRACPRLSSLQLTRTQPLGAWVLRSQTLRTLEITDSSAESITLDMPALEALTVRRSLRLHSLRVRGPVGVRLTLLGVPSLEAVDVPSAGVSTC